MNQTHQLLNSECVVMFKFRDKQVNTTILMVFELFMYVRGKNALRYIVSDSSLTLTRPIYCEHLRHRSLFFLSFFSQLLPSSQLLDSCFLGVSSFVQKRERSRAILTAYMIDRNIFPHRVSTLTLATNSSRIQHCGYLNISFTMSYPQGSYRLHNFINPVSHKI